MSDIVLIYITVPSEEKSQEITRSLLEKHLIACATMWPCKSMYWWDGAIQNDQEFIILAKTTENKVELLKQAVASLHPYTIPCILKIAATANTPYAQWVSNEVETI